MFIRCPTAITAVALALAGCASPNPYGGGPAPVVDRSTLSGDAAARQNAGPGPAPVDAGDGIEITPLGDDALAPDDGGLVIEDLPPPQPAGPPTIQRRPKPPALPPQPAGENQAVAALLASAADHLGQGSYDNAAADLERAVRIEPNNAAIWYDLGQIREAQGNYSDAEAMAAKSNGLARGDRLLQACNWQLIARARRAQGNLPGADVADAQVSQLGGCSR